MLFEQLQWQAEITCRWFMLFFAVAEELISLVADSGKFDVQKVNCMRIKRKKKSQMASLNQTDSKIKILNG